MLVYQRVITSQSQESVMFFCYKQDHLQNNMSRVAPPCKQAEITSTIVSGGCLITGKGIATSYYMGNIIKADGNGKDTTLKNQFTEPIYRWKYVTIGFHIMMHMFSTSIQKVFKKIGRIPTTFYLAGYLRLAMWKADAWFFLWMFMVNDGASKGKLNGHVWAA